MRNVSGKTYRPDQQHCTCCGRQIKHVVNHENLLLFLDETSAKRRGYQCINCKQITCFRCSDNRRRCACGGNAWIAMAYLDRTTAKAAAQS